MRLACLAKPGSQDSAALRAATGNFAALHAAKEMGKLPWK
jgi:hypothetical protein